MPLLRTQIERALDELTSQEEGMRFQGLAVVLGKLRWPELIACERKNDLGLDAYAPESQTPERIGKGLSASITPTLDKISGDANTAKGHFPDLKALLFVTSAKVGNPKQVQWKQAIQERHRLELHIISREDIIIEMMMPANASLCASFLHLETHSEPQVADLIVRTKRAANVVARTWAVKTKGYPLIHLTAARLDPNGAESAEVLSLEQIDQVLANSGRIVLEGSSGRGKTTTLIQLAQRVRTAGTPFIVELPAWISSHRNLLEYIAGMPAFQSEGLTSTDLARVQEAEPILFLLNGWNEIAESNSPQANDAVRELERDFPRAGIIVTTRTHYMTPPLPGAIRLRLMPLRRVQRTIYLTARLGTRSSELRERINATPSLDELTRTPFILSEVASLFEAGAEIPSTKIGVLAQVLRLQEQRDEHRNALQAAPISGLQTDYLKALATEMTVRGAVALSDAEARAVATAVARKLVYNGQIEPVGAPAILAKLTAHHVLERVDYPQTTFQFEHHQLQEYYATLEIRARLLDLQRGNREAIDRFTADYVNNPAWAEPLRMIAETFAEQTGNGEIDKRNTQAGVNLVEMALSLAPVFAGELARLCGAAVWTEVRRAVGERIRGIFAIPDGSFRLYAIAAMLATGADEFGDIIVPLLSGQDQQTRLRTYRLWPDIQVSSFGPTWREQVRGWSDEARADFISELLHHRIDGEVAAFAAEDNCIEVKKAAVSGLMWAGADDTLSAVLESMDAPTLDEVVRTNAENMPTTFRPRAITAIRKFLEITADPADRLRGVLDLIELGETSLDGVLKGSIGALPTRKIRNLSSHFLQPALEYLRKSDSDWVTNWVATNVANGALSWTEHWLQFIPAVPVHTAEEYLRRLETDDFEGEQISGLVAVISRGADRDLAARVFTKVREVRNIIETEPCVRHEFEWKVLNRLETVFRNLPDDIAVAGLLSSVTRGDSLDIKVAAGLLSRVARPDAEPLHISDAELKAHLRGYLKGSVELVLRQQDVRGEERANLSSSIAQIGDVDDMADLVLLIRSDIERMRCGRAARAAGDQGPLGGGGSFTYASWHIASVKQLDGAAAEQVLIDLLCEPDYLSAVASAIACEFLPKQGRSFVRATNYETLWAARGGRIPPLGDAHRRAKFSAALTTQARLLQEQCSGRKPTELIELAKALAVVDPRGSSALIIEAISSPGPWNQYLCLEVAECLLMAGVVLPETTLMALISSVLERTGSWMQDSDRYLLLRILSLCPFVDDPATGIENIREVLRTRQFRPYELREIVTALGESRSIVADDLLFNLASEASIFDQCDDNFFNALAALDTDRSRDLLLGFIDPDIPGIALTRLPHHEGVLVARLSELASRNPVTAARMRDLCDRDLPELNRYILSKVMNALGTPEALGANLNQIDDTKPTPIPQGIWDQLEDTFIERRPYGQSSNTFTTQARASNDLRFRLFRMATEDKKRRKSAFILLAHIEMSRLEYGRPTGEPRHPDLASGRSWPPGEPSEF